MKSASHYDLAIIGAGLSGLAAGIRAAHYGKCVIILERHNVIGGLNSFYSIDGRKYDVGLHAITNFVPPSVKNTPLGKILRQLRLDREALDLCEQCGSAVRFPGVELRFSNDITLLENQVAERFPKQIDGFRALLADIRSFDDTALDSGGVTARALIRRRVNDPLLEDMLLCPVFFYGSAQEHDMDALQFVIMFKAVYLEGFCRPFEGVRPLLRTLADRFRESGGERRMKCGVKKIHTTGSRVSSIELDDGSHITADLVFSSAGAVETERLCSAAPTKEHSEGALSFVETIQIYDAQPAADFGWGTTIVFYNDSERFRYAGAEETVDTRSGIICIPNNFHYGERRLKEGVVRTTCLANFDTWAALPEAEYRAAKLQWFDEVTASARRFLPTPKIPIEPRLLATDMFTPTTVRRYTGHVRGAIYGSPEKTRDGRTDFQNLHLIGTDQGYLGIVGAMLSGIIIANNHALR